VIVHRPVLIDFPAAVKAGDTDRHALLEFKNYIAQDSEFFVPPQPTASERLF
jgi:hypothetical protein